MNRNCKKIAFTDQILHIARVNPTLIHYCTITAPFYVVTVCRVYALCSLYTLYVRTVHPTTTRAAHNFAILPRFSCTHILNTYIPCIEQENSLGFVLVSPPVQLMEIVTALQCMNSILMKFYRFCLLMLLMHFRHTIYYMHFLSEWYKRIFIRQLSCRAIQK